MYLFLKACFLSFLFHKVLTFFGIYLLFCNYDILTNFGCFNFCKMCKIPEKKFGRERLKYIFFIFQLKDMLNLGLNFANLSPYLLINVIKKNVIRKN